MANSNYGNTPDSWVSRFIMHERPSTTKVGSQLQVLGLGLHCTRPTFKRTKCCTVKHPKTHMYELEVHNIFYLDEANE